MMSVLRKLGVVLPMLVLSDLAMGSPYSHSLSLQTGLDHDSNPMMVDADVRSVSRVWVTPSYRLMRVDGPVSWSLGGQVNFVRSSDQELSLNRSDPNVRFDWQREYERGYHAFNLGYRASSTRSEELDELGFSRRVEGTRKQLSLGADWVHQMSDRLEASLSVSVDDVRFDEDVRSDYRNTGLGLTLVYALSERDDLYGNLSYNHSDMELSSALDSTHYSALMGWKRELDELWRLDASLGLSRDEGLTDNTGWHGNLRLNYVGERTTGRLSFGRSNEPSSFGGYTESNKALGSLAYEVSERNRLGASLVWRENLSNQDTTYTNTKLWFSRELAEDVSLNLSYQFKTTDSNDREADGHVWLLSLGYVFPEW